MQRPGPAWRILRELCEVAPLDVPVESAVRERGGDHDEMRLLPTADHQGVEERPAKSTTGVKRILSLVVWTQLIDVLWGTNPIYEDGESQTFRYFCTETWLRRLYVDWDEISRSTQFGGHSRLPKVHHPAPTLHPCCCPTLFLFSSEFQFPIRIC